MFTLFRRIIVHSTEMGCGAARAVAVSPASSKPNIKGNANENGTDSGDTSCQDRAQNYEYLVNNCSTFKCPPGTVPIICLDDDTIPVIESPLLLDESHQTGIFLPVISANIKSKGRIICYGNIDMFNRTYFNSGDTANVLYNSLIWLNGKKSVTNSIHFISFPNEYQSEMKNCFAPHGIHIIFEDYNSELINEQFIMIPTYFDLENKENLQLINEILNKGGGIGIIYVPEKNTNHHLFPINKFLLSFGLSYSLCSLSDQGGNAITVKVHESFDQSKRFTFSSLVDQFDRFVNTKNRNLSYLDDLATAIRYHVLVSGSNHVGYIEKLLNLSWKYLQDTDYRLDCGMVCPFVNHSIAAILIEELYPKIPASRVRPHVEDASTFPGLASSDCVYSENSVRIKLSEESLISTGFWVAPGSLCTVEAKRLPKGTRVQIGCHNVPLLSKPGPWKRWPNLTFSYVFDSAKIEVSSPFGGIVYLAVPEMSALKSTKSLLFEPNKSEGSPTEAEAAPLDKDNENAASRISDEVKLTFSNVTVYPRAVKSDPGVYASTSKSQVPWGEFVSDSVIFTLPSKIMEQIQNFEETFNFIEKVVKLTATYMNYQIVRPYRIVFDIETTDDYEYQQQQQQFQLLQQQLQFISQKNTTGMTSGSLNCSPQNAQSISSCLNIGGNYNNTDFNNYVANMAKHFTSDNPTSDFSNTSTIVSRYPIVMLFEDIHDIFFCPKKPNSSLFKMIMSIALVSLREGVFDNTTELALSAFVASNVFTQIFPFYDPIEQSVIDMPILFNELWLIHMQINKKIIPEILRRSQNDDAQSYEVPEDRWIAFVMDLSNLAKLNFSSILKKVKPIPLNAISNLESLKNAPPLMT